MAVGNGIASNYAVLSILSYWRGVLTAGSTLRLYQNNVTVTPTLSWSSFVEATFTGYSAANLTGLFPVPVNVAPGEYQVNLPPQIFNCTAGSQTIYGAAILDAGANLWYAFPFSTPVLYSAGTSYAVTIALQEWAASTIP